MAGNALLAPDIVGLKQDLADRVYTADVKATPGIASIKKGEPLSVMLYDFIVKSYGERKPGGYPDGQDVDAYDMQSPKKVLQARAEEFRRAPHVGGQAQAISEAGGVAGTRSLYNESRADQLMELGRDVEKELWSDQDSQPSSGPWPNGSKFRGVGKWLSRGSFAELPIPAESQIPASQRYTGSIATMSEGQFAALIQAKYENTGASSDLRGFATPTVMSKVSTFAFYTPDVTNQTSSVFITSGRLQGNTLFGATVDVYKSQWGTFKLFPVLNDFMPDAYTAYFLDMDHPRIRSLGPIKEYMNLEDKGGGPRGLYKWILSVHVGDPRAHAVIDGTI